MINGIIFQRDDNREYKGVEWDNWYLNNIFFQLIYLHILLTYFIILFSFINFINL